MSSKTNGAPLEPVRQELAQMLTSIADRIDRMDHMTRPLKPVSDALRVEAKLLRQTPPSEDSHTLPSHQ